jgi:hypothetical protein
MVRTGRQGESEGNAQGVSASGSHLIPRIYLYATLSNLQFTFKFIRRFIIRKCASSGNEGKDSVLVTVVADVAANRVCIPHHASYVWPALKQKVPLTPYLVHLFLFKFSSSHLTTVAPF